jgi:hypothetical protein
MARFFNTAGPCDPSSHYMLPPASRLPEIGNLIDRQLYFVVHAPRQSGKTTLVRTLAHRLAAEGRHAAVEQGHLLAREVLEGQRAHFDVER